MLMSIDVHEPAATAGVAVEALANGRAELKFTTPGSGGVRVAPNITAAPFGDFPGRTTGHGWRSDPFRPSPSRRAA